MYVRVLVGFSMEWENISMASVNDVTTVTTADTGTDWQQYIYVTMPIPTYSGSVVLYGHLGSAPPVPQVETPAEPVEPPAPKYRRYIKRAEELK